MPLGDVAETALGKMLDRGKSRGNSDVPYLRNVNVQWGRIDSHDVLSMELADEERDRYSVKAGDLLVCEGGEIGRAAIWQGPDFAYQKALHRVRSRGELDLRYLRYLLEHQSVSGTLARYATGSTIAHLPQQALRRVPVPLPGLREQWRIVEILEDHLSRLDSGTQSLTTAARRSDALELACLRPLLRDEGSERVVLSDLLDLSIGGVWGEQPGVEEVDVAVLRVTELRPGGKLDASTAAARSVSRRTLASRQLVAGDLLLEKSGGGPKQPVGRVGLVPELNTQSVCSNFMQLMRPKREVVTPKYLHLYLNAFHRSGGTEGLQKASTNIRNIKASDYLRMEVPVPILAAQRRLVAEAQEHQAASAQMRNSALRAERRSQALRRALLTVAFSGRLTGSTFDLQRAEEAAAAQS